VVTLPEEIREDRGHFLIYDERFVRRSGDAQPETHAFCVAEPRREHERFRVGGPVNWPTTGTPPSTPTPTRAETDQRGR
jgi:hypothetical protein